MFDITLLFIIAFFVLFGFMFGAIQTFGAVVGIGAGAYIANNYYAIGIPFVSGFVSQPMIAKIVSYILVFVVVNRLIGLVFMVLDKIFDLLKIIPFLSTINRLGGAVLGLIEGVTVVAVVLFFISGFVSKIPALNSALNASAVAPVLITIGKVVSQLF